MGKNVNKGNTGFHICRNSGYVDKSGLLAKGRKRVFSSYYHKEYM